MAFLASPLPPQEQDDASTSTSSTQVEPFNAVARQAFYIMLEGRRDQARERVTASEKLKYIRWLTEIVPERLNATAGKKRAWVRAEFVYQQGKLWKLPGRLFKELREVISEDSIYETIIQVHNSLGHVGQHATASKINNEY